MNHPAVILPPTAVRLVSVCLTKQLLMQVAATTAQVQCARHGATSRYCRGGKNFCVCWKRYSYSSGCF
jgi:hypothetical protein